VTLKRQAPYDERNALDYLEMSKRIADALEEIEHDSGIPVTEQELAKRARCSRGTLRNRRYPLERLQSIKAKRKEIESNKSRKITREHRIAVDVHIEDKNMLLAQLKNSRTEVAVWFNKFTESDSEKNKSLRINELLLKENKALKERIGELLRKIDDQGVVPNTESTKDVIIPFPDSKRMSNRKVTTKNKK
jgi:DNA polymerase III delta prime subunit